MIINAIVLLLLLIFIGRITINAYRFQELKQQKFFLILLFIEHFSLMGFAYYTTIKQPDYDAFLFYQKVFDPFPWINYLRPGSDFLTFLIYPLVKSGLSLFTLFVLFATMSYQAFIWYFQDFVDYFSKVFTVFKIPVTQWMLLLPSFHYWSGFLGKDALVFFLITYLLFKIKKRKIININNALSLFLIAILRPHFFLMIVFIFIIHFMLSKEVAKKIKLYFLILSGLLIALFIPILIRFMNIKALTYNSFVEKIDQINTFAVKGGSGISLSESNYFERILLLLFRPLFVDAKNNIQVVVSIENLIVLLFFLLILIIFTSKKYKIKFTDDVYFSLLLGIGMVLMISLYIYNLGLASRMRLMFFPLMFYAIHQIIHQNKNITQNE